MGPRFETITTLRSSFTAAYPSCGLGLQVLVAPDKFKGTLSAAEAARAMETGVRRALPSASIDRLPLADGGEGTVEALLESLGGRHRTVTVAGPNGRPVGARLAELPDGHAALEMSSASGLSLVASDERDALRASSEGTGELLRAALDAGCAGVIVGVGGSASTDGGTGAARAVGWRFLDRRGRDLPPGGGALVRLARIDAGRVDARLSRVAVVGACDVGNPLIGRSGAARTFGPQKGASASEVERLEDALKTLAERVRADLGTDVSSCWGGGAGGGMGAGLRAFFGATLEAGFDLVADRARLGPRVARADVVITGEGRLDAPSLGGKVPVGVARVARSAGVACVAVAGEVTLEEDELRSAGFTRALALVEVVGDRRARQEPAAAVVEATAALLGALPPV
jgi:glycerate kinase